MFPNHHHHHNGVAACATNPPHPCFPGMRFLVLVKGLHWTFTRFFNLIWSYHALDGPSLQIAPSTYPYQMMGPDSTRECVAHHPMIG